VTLYSPKVIQQRERWFAQWLEVDYYWTLDNIRSFHKTAGEGDSRYALRMNRPNQYATVSLTSALHSGWQSAMLYEDFKPQPRTHQNVSNNYVSALPTLVNDSENSHSKNFKQLFLLGLVK